MALGTTHISYKKPDRSSEEFDATRTYTHVTDRVTNTYLSQT